MATRRKKGIIMFIVAGLVGAVVVFAYGEKLGLSRFLASIAGALPGSGSKTTTPPTV